MADSICEGDLSAFGGPIVGRVPVGLTARCLGSPISQVVRIFGHVHVECITAAVMNGEDSELKMASVQFSRTSVSYMDCTPPVPLADPGVPADSRGSRVELPLGYPESQSNSLMLRIRRATAKSQIPFGIECSYRHRPFYYIPPHSFKNPSLSYKLAGVPQI
jgi:hypothetical protein